MDPGIVRFSLGVRGTGLAGRTVDFNDVFSGAAWSQLQPPMNHPDFRAAVSDEMTLLLTPQQFDVKVSNGSDDDLEKAFAVLKAVSEYAGKGQLSQFHNSWHCHLLAGDDAVAALRNRLRDALPGLFKPTNDLPVQVSTSSSLSGNRAEEVELYLAPESSAGGHAKMVVVDLSHAFKFQPSKLKNPTQAAARESKSVSQRLEVIRQAISEGTTT